MNERLKHRLVGATVLIALFVIVIPFFIQFSERPTQITLNDFTPPAEPPLPVAEEVIETAWEAVPQLPIAEIDLDSDVIFADIQESKVLDAATTELVTSAEILMATEPTPERVIESDSSPTISSSESLGYFRDEDMYVARSGELFSTEGAATIVDDLIAEAPLAEVQQAPEKPTGPLWVVQLGSFANLDNVERLANELTEQGYSVHTVTAPNSAGTMITRVVVGAETDKASAEQLQAELAERVALHGIVIQEKFA